MLSTVPLPSHLAFLKAQPFAHRGLHGGEVVENSMGAFEAAIAEKHGIECDVRASADGVAFVFHDATLERLTEERGPLVARTADLLDPVVLVPSGEPVPRLSALLDLIAGRVPLLIEIKSPEDSILPICRAVANDLKSYEGAVAIMSFNPRIVGWFAKYAPDVVRGLVVSEQGKHDVKGRIERALSLRTAKPAFLAYDIRDLPSEFAETQRRRGMPVLTWTVRSAAQERIAFTYADEIIYERMGH